MRETKFTEGEYYHIFNRGVEKRFIFLDDSDRYRFTASIYYLNDASGRPARIGRLINNSGQNSVLTRKGENLVNILCWCLMPNHFHLLVKETREKGISLFMHRLQVSFSLYFNTKYRRTGALLGGPFKAVHVSSDGQYTHASRYIHLNPIDLFDPQWKERGYVENKSGAVQFLEKYRWSSLPDYLEGNTPFASLIDKDEIMEYFENKSENYKQFLMEWSDWSELSSDHEGYDK